MTPEFWSLHEVSCGVNYYTSMIMLEHNTYKISVDNVPTGMLRIYKGLKNLLGLRDILSCSNTNRSVKRVYQITIFC